MRSHIYLFVLILFPQIAIAQSVEFACGTSVRDVPYYSDTATIKCGPNAVTEIDPASPQIVCHYNAVCIPATPTIRQFIESGYPGKQWNQLSDDDINVVVQKNFLNNTFPFDPDPSLTSVECLGGKKEDGSPDCPKVNDCINNKRYSNLTWQLKPIRRLDPADGVRENSQGFRLRQDRIETPRGISR